MCDGVYVLLDSFDLDVQALQWIRELVHYLDVDERQLPEASGMELVLTGLCETHIDDLQLLLSASRVFDSLFATHTRENRVCTIPCGRHHYHPPFPMRIIKIPTRLWRA